MAKRIAIKAESRSSLGRIQAKKSRAAGKIPGVLYGLGAAQPIQLAAVEIVQAINATGGESTLVDLEIDARKHLALISEFQVHPVQDRLLHVDFHEVDPNKKMHAEVAVHETGEAIGVKEGGGVLDHVLRHLRVECLPADLPDGFTVDVSGLTLGQAIHVRDIATPKGVTILNDAELTVFAVHEPKVEVLPEATAADGATAAEPEVITAKKDKEDGAAAGDKGDAKSEKKAEKK
ncbi:MAG: 50S ribosomal protein L25 [Verrucomicrobiales bacterium]|jgi:large subunit ribosomal protein L25|nr:50S ribosomal protein L25 [Verrucomicrobiales bacterium]